MGFNNMHDKQKVQVTEAPEVSGTQSNDEVPMARRQAILKVAQKAAFVAPATLALLSMEAKASSLTC